GRRESMITSDLDYAFFFDSEVVSPGRADALRRRCIAALRKDFDVPEKTFCSAIDVRDLMRNVGGEHDSNTHLTYRALLLTEGVWLHNSPAAQRIRTAVFSIYARARVSRGRFLTSLGND